MIKKLQMKKLHLLSGFLLQYFKNSNISPCNSPIYIYMYFFYISDASWNICFSDFLHLQYNKFYEHV